MIAEQKTTQVRLKNRRTICADVPWGAPVFVTPTVAKLLADQGVVDIIGAGMPGPSQFKPAGPTAGKIISTVRGDEKKVPSSVDLAGPSTDSAPSSESGTAEQSPSSAEAPVSPASKSPQSKPRGRPRK